MNFANPQVMGAVTPEKFESLLSMASVTLLAIFSDISSLLKSKTCYRLCAVFIEEMRLDI